MRRTNLLCLVLLPARLWALGLLLVGVPAFALTLELPGKVIGEKERSAVPGSYALPLAPFDGSGVPSRAAEGALDQRAFELEAPGLTTLAVLAPLREQVLAICPQLQNGSQVVECSSLETLRNMVALGLGVSILPSSATASSACALHALAARPLQSAPVRSIALAWRASFPRHKAIDALRCAIQTCSWQFTTAHGSRSSGSLVENQRW